MKIIISIKNKFLLFLSFLIVFIFSSIAFASALEVPLPGLKNNPSLSEYVVYLFGFIISIAGVIALISFVVGAIGLINPNVEAHGDAKDRMIGAVLGLVLTACAFLILQTINPNLVSPTLTPLPGVAGVFYTNGSEKAAVSDQVGDVAKRGDDLIKNGYNKLLLDCTNSNGSNDPVLLVWEFPKAGFQGNDSNYSGASVKRIGCGESEDISSLGSFKWAFETPGVYYYLGANCGGLGSSVVTSSQNSIEAPFRGNIKSVKIVNNPAKDLYYGVIFHANAGLENGGACSLPITKNDCNPIGINNLNPFAADIFLMNKTPATSGTGVIFYSEAYGWNTGISAGKKILTNTDIAARNGSYETFASELSFDYTNINRPEAYKHKCNPNKPSDAEGNKEGVDCSQNGCEAFEDCMGSIKINGRYLIKITWMDKSSIWGPCQTFTQDVEELDAKQIGGSKAYFVDVIATN